MERIIYIYWYILLHVYITYETDRYIHIRRDVETEIERLRENENIKVRINKKVFIENSTGIKNYPVSVNKVIS